MAKPVAYRVFTPGDAREELKRKIDAAPTEHAEAILGGFRLLEEAHQSGTLELLRGALAAQDSIINHVVGIASQPEMGTRSATCWSSARCWGVSIQRCWKRRSAAMTRRRRSTRRHPFSRC